jgi:hypothetical protein
MSKARLEPHARCLSFETRLRQAQPLLRMSESSDAATPPSALALCWAVPCPSSAVMAFAPGWSFSTRPMSSGHLAFQ